jgi:hypothetical protein
MMESKELDDALVDKLFQLDLNSLLILIGQEDDALFASPPDLRKRGLRLFRNAVESIKNEICKNDFIEKYCQNDKDQRKVAAVAAISDLLGGGGAVTVAALIVQVGIENICAGTWDIGND